ncbi:unnamed protein product [Notodromas monacha]|uniref:Uncharacterized protein n=1 Tax=Notodromas monacha TaxID=399045 RepID=A0A7R9BQZ4_9CRUS|nr:unnamed protein product [Notodromas monacha]CAG0918992.1 unnamed protein product [Notodromas monacha]
MNGEDLRIPTTTLAGIASLTDCKYSCSIDVFDVWVVKNHPSSIEVLPEMPLPCPLPQAYGSRSLLFHPRVAEEAKRLISSVCEPELLDQLLKCLHQTTADHIELKDPQPPGDSLLESCPEILRAALQRGLFTATLRNSVRHGNQENHVVAKPRPHVRPTAQGSENSAGTSNCVSGRAHKPDQSLCDTPTKEIHSSHMGDINAVCHAKDKHQGMVNSIRDNGHLSCGGLTHEDTVTTCVQMNKTEQHSSLNSSKITENAQTDSGFLAKVDSQVASGNSARLAFDEVLSSTGPEWRGDVPNWEKGEPRDCVNHLKSEESESLGRSDMNLPKHVVEPVAAVINGPRNHMHLDDIKLMGTPVVQLSRLGLTDQMYLPNATKCSEPDLKPLVEQQSDSDEDSKKHKIFRAKGKEREESKRKERESVKRKRDASEEPWTDIDKSTRRKVEEVIPVELTPKKPKVRRVELKLVPVLDRLNVEEVQENNTYQRLSKLMDQAFEAVDDMDLTPDNGDKEVEENDDDEDSVPAELLLSEYLLNQLREESGRLKDRGAMDLVPTDKLVRLIQLMLKNIRPAVSLNPLIDPEDEDEGGRLWMGIAMERIVRSVNASLVVLNIITSKNMPKRVYMDDVIDKIVSLTKYQLQVTIFPSYDPVYRTAPKNKKGDLSSALLD